MSLSRLASLHHLAVYAAFLVLVCLFTFPLIVDLGASLRPHNDPRAFTWVLGWVASRLFTNPLGLFDGNIFYPHGRTLAYSEPLLVPALVPFGPIYALSGNPVLAYNVTLLLWSALGGWAAYYAGWRLTGSRLGGWVAGIVFSLSPFRTGYYNIITMQFSFAVPLAFLAFARFLERQRIRDLAWALLFVWCQAVSVWYFGIPLVLLLVVLALGFLLLRPHGWQIRTLAASLMGAVILALALLPVARPYLETRRELGFERSLEDAAERPADLLSYLDSGPEHRFYRLATSRRYPTLFPGFTTFALAALAFLWLRAPEPVPLPPFVRRAKRLIAWALTATLAAIALFLATGGGRLRILGVALRMTGLDRTVTLLLLLGAAALAIEGWGWARNRRDRPLSPREWVALLGLLTAFFVLLTLGPVMLLGNRPVGQGIYALVYPLFPALGAIRIPLRIGVLSLFLIGLLATFGLAWLQTRLGGSRALHALTALPILLLIEYVSFPLPYERIRWDDPPPVYRWLAREPGDFAILEWPSADEYLDADYLLWSLLHRKRLVHGISGFIPEFTQEVWAAVATLPDPDALARLRSIHPLRYLIVHLNRLNPEDRQRWERWAQQPPAGLTMVSRFGESVAFSLGGAAERSREWERTFSSDYVAPRPRARLTVALTREDSEIRPSVEVTFNGKALTRLTPTAVPAEVHLLLPPPYPKAERNRFRLQHTYRLLIPTATDPRYRIGQTGVASPVDLVVTSAAKEYGNLASIVVNGVDVSPNRRGYNVVVVDPGSGTPSAREAFDTFADPGAGRRLARFVRDVPPGWIVVAAIKDEGVGQLTEDAIDAFRSLGGSTDPRGSLFISHLVIGVKGAPAGSAIEYAAHRRLERVVGVDRRDRMMGVGDFRLE